MTKRTIESVEFWELLVNVIDQCSTEKNIETEQAIVAHIDARLAAAYEQGKKENNTALERAEKSLIRFGFEDLSGEEWKPPIGKPPVFIVVSQPVAAQPEPIAKFFRYNRGGSGEFIGVEWLIPGKDVPDEGDLFMLPKEPTSTEFKGFTEEMIGNPVNLAHIFTALPKEPT
tara:strand:+ start:215 stop:730 length:516 start_codon:yes stop_codon:yes gene_type:complete